MAHVMHIPKYLAPVVGELARRFPGEAEVTRERAPDGYRYTIAVLSPRFSRMNWSQRHASVWQVAKQLLTHEQLFRVTILPLRPGEMNGVD